MLVYPRPLEPTPKWQMKIDRRAKYVMRLYLMLEKRYDNVAAA